MAIFIIGGTGLVGSHFLSQISGTSERVVALTRRLPPIFKDATPSNIDVIVDTDTTKWSEDIKNCDVSSESVFVSSFGTTRGNAGSAEKFKEIDYGINYTSFKAAKESGKFDKAILVSSVGANENSSFLYMKTKGELERDVQALGFKTTVILRPGVLLGAREQSKGLGNTVAECVGNWVRDTPLAFVASYPIKGEEVAKCAKIIAESNIDKELLIIQSKEIREIANRGSL